MGSEDEDLLLETTKAMLDRLGVELPKELNKLPFKVVFTTLGVLPYLISSVSALKPKFLVYDACAPWGWMLSEILRVPGASFMTALPAPRSARETATELYSDLAKQALKACASAIKVAYGIDYNYNYAYANYAPYTLVTSSRAWHREHEDFSPEQFHYWGPMIAARKAETKAMDAVGRLLADESVGRGRERPLAFCSLGTVTTGEAYVVFGRAVEDYYTKCLQAASMLPQVSFLFAVGGQTPVAEEESPDGCHRIVKLFGQPVPDNVVVARSVDQPAVLKRASIFITHCGQNSSTEAIVAAVPVIVAPFFGDQIDNAKRFIELGMGLEESYHKELVPCSSMQWNPDYDKVTSASLRDKIVKVLSMPSFKEASETFLEEQTRELGDIRQQVADLVENMRKAQEATSMGPVYCQ
eukprot:TRINITY_DN26957_c0_g1_i2.p1 TRINITY_DN26957_c0_g1~~TRINITY_DN26957_c0_g1_i2.p1  ORF type:complete len:412 (+),score=75.04 TRINITY_DN26957_c0_g1_i2:552-1787(+)